MGGMIRTKIEKLVTDFARTIHGDLVNYNCFTSNVQQVMSLTSPWEERKFENGSCLEEG